MTLGFFAPLPPTPSGVADYAARMLEELSHLGEIRVNQPGERNLYHIGNNRLHAEIYQRALRDPGVVLLHDALLHHLLIGTLDEAAYQKEFGYNYGSWSLDLAAVLWRERARAMSDPRFFRYPLLKRLVERSLGVVVHSEAARRAVLAHHPTARARVIPHLSLEDPAAIPTSSERDRFRREALGLGANDFLMGVYGHLRETKRVASVLEALGRLRAEGVPARLLVAGGFASDDYRRAIGPQLAAHPAVILRGNTPPPEFRLLLAAADVCVNLKHPSIGDSSGIAVRAMALGVPVLLSDGSETAGFPPGSCVPVVTGPGEVPALVESLRWLARDPRARLALARAAHQECLGPRHPTRVCADLWNWLRELEPTA